MPSTSPPPRDGNVLIQQVLPQETWLGKKVANGDRQGKFLGPRRPLATQRLQKQYLHEIPPSPPVHLASMNIFDPKGRLIEHPLQFSLKPAMSTEDGGRNPLTSPARSTGSDRGGLPGPGLDQGSTHPTPGRPPQMFIKRHHSQRSESSQTSSSGRSRDPSTSSSPLADSPMSPSPLASGVLSPLTPLSPAKVLINVQRKGLTMIHHPHGTA